MLPVAVGFFKFKAPDSAVCFYWCKPSQTGVVFSAEKNDVNKSLQTPVPSDFCPEKQVEREVYFL